MPLFGPPNVHKLKANRDVRGLVKALGYNKDASVRQAAAVALDTLGWKPEKDEAGALYWIEKRRWTECSEIGMPAVKPLIAVLRDRALGEDIRGGAAEALGRIGDGQAVEPLADVLKTDQVAEVRRAAAKALGQIGDARAVKPLGAALTTDNRWVCTSAAEALGQIGDARAVESLVAALDAHHLKSSFEKKDVREAAAKALVKIGAPAVEPLIVVLMHKDASIRRAAVEALGQIGDTRAVNPLGIVLETDKDGWVRLDAVKSLGHIGGAKAVELLGVVLKTEGSWAVRQVAVEALGEIGGTEAAELLEAVLTTEKEYEVRRAAVGVLGQIGGTKAVELLEVVLKTENHPSVRRAAVKVLGQILGTKAVELLEVVLKTEKDTGVRMETLEALGRIGGAKVVELLGAVVTMDENSVVRESAAWHLGQAGLACDIELLVTLLRNRDWRVRQAALYGLKSAGWEPCSDLERAACWIVSGEANRLAELDCQAIRQLLIESMEWEAGPDNWHIKGPIAKLLVRPETAANDSILARAEDELEIYAKKCAEYLDIMVKHSREIEIRGCQAMFEDYADLIVKAISYQVSDSGDGAGGRFYHYEASSSLQAVMAICQIATPIATNLLHHLSKLRDSEVTSRTFEAAYDSEHPSGAGAHTIGLSFEDQRDAAQKELARRGNPDYDLSAYRAEDCWRIPK